MSHTSKALTIFICKELLCTLPFQKYELHSFVVVQFYKLLVPFSVEIFDDSFSNVSNLFASLLVKSDDCLFKNINPQTWMKKAIPRTSSIVSLKPIYQFSVSKNSEFIRSRLSLLRTLLWFFSVMMVSVSKLVRDLCQ